MGTSQYWGRLFATTIVVTLGVFLIQYATHAELGGWGLFFLVGGTAFLLPCIVDAVLGQINKGTSYFVRMLGYLFFTPATVLLVGALFPGLHELVGVALATIVVGFLTDLHEHAADQHGLSTKVLTLAHA